MAKIFFPKYKALFYTLGLVLVLVVVAERLYVLGNFLSAELIKTLVASESKKRYQLDFEYLRLQPLKKQITMAKIRLEPNVQILAEDSLPTHLYHVSIDSIRIDLASVLDIYFQKKLKILGVDVLNPEIRMTRTQEEFSGLKFGTETGSLYDIISSYLQLLRIDYFIVRGAGVKHQPSNVAFDQIDFRVNNFLIEAKKRQRKLFYSESIQLGLVRQEIYLPDSIHVLNFDSFQLSTADSLLVFKDFIIKERENLQVQPDLPEKNRYNIHVPLLQLKGLDYLKAYEDNHLVIEEVYIPDPKISLIAQIKEGREGNPEDNFITQALISLFDQVNISHLSIKEGQLDISIKAQREQRFVSNRISIELFDIQVDSSNYLFDSRQAYFQHAMIDISDYQYQLPDSLHTLTFDKFELNTFQESLLVEGFSIKPRYRSKYRSITKMDIEVPNLLVRGLSYLKILEGKTIDLAELELLHPSIRLENPKVKNQQAAEIRPISVWRSISPFFEKIQIHALFLDDGKMAIDDEILVEQIGIMAREFRLDSTRNSWHHLASFFQVGAGNTQIKQEEWELKWKKLQSNRQGFNWKLNDLNLAYQDTTISASLQLLDINGLNLDSLLFYGKIHLDTLIIKNLESHLDLTHLAVRDSAAQRLFSQAFALEIDGAKGNISQSENKVDWQLSTFTSTIDTLGAILIKKLVLDTMKIKYGSWLATMNGLKFLNSDSTLSGSYMHIKKLGEHNDVQDPIELVIDTMYLKGIDQYALWVDKRLNADKLSVHLRNYDFNLGNQFGKSDSVPSWQISIPEVDISWSKGLVNWHDEENISINYTSDTGYVHFDQVHFPSDIDSTTFKFFDRLQAGWQDLHLNFGGDSLYFGRLRFDTKEGSASGEDLSLFRYRENLDLKFSALEMVGMDMPSLWFNNELLLEKLELIDGAMLLEYKSDSRSLQEEMKNPFRKVDIGRIKLSEFDVNVFHSSKNRFFNAYDVKVVLDRLRIDSLFKWKKAFEYLDSATLTGVNYREDVLGEYQLYTERYTFIYPGLGARLENIMLINNQDRFSHAESLSYQKDWYDLRVPRLEIKGLDANRMLSQNEYIAQSLRLDRIKFSVYRDLNLPMDSLRYVPLFQEAMEKIPVLAGIDSIQVNGEIDVYVNPIGGMGVAHIGFHDLQATVMHWKSRHQQQDVVLMGTGKINQEASFTARVSFPWEEWEGSPFLFSGSVGAMDLRSLNQLLVPLAAIEIRSGNVQQMSLSFSGNNQYTQGQMDIRYSNLKVNFLDRESYQASGAGSNLRTFFANTFVIKSRNMSYIKPRVGLIFYERDTQRSIFNLWSKSILSGAVSSVGINRNRDKARRFFKALRKEEQQENEKK